MEEDGRTKTPRIVISSSDDDGETVPSGGAKPAQQGASTTARLTRSRDASPTRPKTRKVSDPCRAPLGAEEDVASLRLSQQEKLEPPFRAAVWQGELEVVRALLAKSPLLLRWTDPATGNSALHLAARAGQVEMLELLIDAGADPEHCSDKGYTALHVAAWSGFLPCVQLLEAKGCNPQQKVSGFHFVPSR
jgi:hypothetical protein